MPIDLVIDERDTKPDLGDNNNSSSNGSGGPGAGMGGASNGGRGGSADAGHHSDSASTPDHQVCALVPTPFHTHTHLTLSSMNTSSSSHKSASHTHCVSRALILSGTCVKPPPPPAFITLVPNDDEVWERCHKPHTPKQ